LHLSAPIYDGGIFSWEYFVDITIGSIFSWESVNSVNLLHISYDSKVK